MSNIRVTYSGLIAFVIGIVGVITGILFIIIVTRRLSPDDFGLWTLIGSLLSYVLFVEPIISYWSTRQIARGQNVAKTALFTSGFFSIGGIVAYFGIAILLSNQLNVDFFPLILATILVPIMYFNNTLTGICLGHRPQGISYSIVAFEVSKLPMGLVFVYFLELGLVGAIIATILASLSKMIVLLIIAHEIMIESIKTKFINFWLRLSWIPLYSRGAGFLLTLDVLIFSMITNSLVGLAFWGISSAVSNLVAHSGQISQALYPKLLATARREFVEENFKKLMYFAIPLLAGAIVFAKPALHIFNPLYVDGIFIVYFLSIRSFAQVLISFFFSTLRGYEAVDLDEHASFKQYMKSKLFLTPTLNYIQWGSYVGLLAAFLLLSKNLELNEIQQVTVWSIIFLATTLPILFYTMMLVRKNYDIKFPRVPIIKYSIATLFSSIIVFSVLDKFLVYSKSIFDFLPQIIPIVIFGGLIYFGISYAWDKSVRDMISSIIRELKTGKKKNR